MDERFQEKYYRIEQTHAWSVARRDILLRLLQKYGVSRSASILDIGCSSGTLIEQLVGAGYENLLAIDVSERAVALCHARGLHQVRHVEGTHTHFDDNVFDCIIASDVLEHIEDEAEALQEWMRLLRPGGLLLLFVPAFALLWSEHDVVNQHFRRYTRGHLVQAARDAGYEVQEHGYWNFLLFFPTAAGRLLSRVREAVSARRGQAPAVAEHDDFAELNPVVNGVIREVMKAENRLMQRGLRFPVGVSTWAVARKPAH